MIVLDRIFGNANVDHFGTPTRNLPCWLWTRSRNDSGYAQVKIGGRKLRAHRVVFELLIGEIPDGLVLDHLCRVRHCINPFHLEPVTPAENTRRGCADRKAAA